MQSYACYKSCITYDTLSHHQSCHALKWLAPAAQVQTAESTVQPSPLDVTQSVTSQQHLLPSTRKIPLSYQASNRLEGGLNVKEINAVKTVKDGVLSQLVVHSQLFAS